MNGKQRREYWRKVERLRAQLDSKYFNATKDSILKQFKRFAKDIEVYGLDGAKSRLGLDLWEKELIKVFESLYKEAAVLFGNATYRAVKIEANRKGETFGFNREWTNALLDFLMKQGFVLVADITKTTKDKLLAIVTKGVEDGLGVDDIVKLILSDEQLAYAAFRARRIVRTEVMRASNMAAMKGAEAHGFEVDKMWISARDSRTRRIPEDEFDHWDMDGVVVPLNEPFTSTGKKGEPVVAMQPGDLQAPAGFTINCRCTVGFIPKRDANGNLIFKPKLNAPIINQNLNLIPPQIPKPIERQENVFVPAKNVKEAEDWAKSNLNVKIDSYKGFDLDVANEINRTIFDIEKQVKTKVNSIVKSGVSGSAYAQYDWGKNELLFRKRYLNIEDRLNKDNDGWAKKYGFGKKYHASNTLRGTIAHEYGHAWDAATNRRLFDEIRQLNLETQNKLYGISGYAAYDRWYGQKKGAELIAELFSARFENTKEWQNLPIELKTLINKYFN